MGPEDGLDKNEMKTELMPGKHQNKSLGNITTRKHDTALNSDYRLKTSSHIAHDFLEVSLFISDSDSVTSR